MSPIAIQGQHHDVKVDAQSLKARTKSANGDAKKPLPVYPDAVAADYMYKFKYNHPLPTHGQEGIEIAHDADPKSVAQEIVTQISQTLGSQDATAFSSLFMKHGVWRDRALFTWDYRTFNFREHILKAASDLLPKTPVSKVTLIEPSPKIERPYPDLSFVQAHISLNTDIAGGTALINIISTKDGYKIWTLNSTLESLHGFPEIPERDGHMTGPHAWDTQRSMDLELEGVEPDVLIVGGGQNGLMLAARLKALGVNALIVERNKRIGDNWRGRYEALSLHLPHWADHFAYMPYPRHWPTYCPAAKLADWFEWYVSAMELFVWIDSSVTNAHQDANGGWTVDVSRGGKGTRTFHPKQLVMATSLAGVPYAPKIPGSEKFKGTIRHSTEHDSSREWVGKKALVVGTSSSGFDTSYDFARRGVDVTILQRSPTYIMSLTHSVPRILGVYKPEDGKRPDLEVADRIAYGMPVGPSEEMGRRLGAELTELDHDLLQGMEDRGFKTWRGQRSTSTQTLGYTKNGGFYFDAGACEQIINGNIKVEQGYIDHFTEDTVVLNGDREQKYDIVILATGFSNTIDSVRKTLGDEVADRFNPIWGMNEEGELNSAWRDTGVPNMWLMVGTLQAARYHSKMVALRIKAKLEGVSPEPYLE
ncbi:uncharacterized protein I303_102617 [Kwoniella dejecticola CBS 10117]|uniref:Flavin-containing monooxygenase n=1 Tax=Kwoniella dejecticola CBS 10117 TaxID=1296121 RepID=A0A1A6A991_9TREE|nr:flavin-containing monooxygenase [Kwoniella dejecticola CBS 10117]OBR86622.1 flavin-containing monooxygenase [Kwoniella dejecticola CBS 10117]